VQVASDSEHEKISDLRVLSPTCGGSLKEFQDGPAVIGIAPMRALSGRPEKIFRSGKRP